MSRLQRTWRLVDSLGWVIAIAFLAVGFYVVHEQSKRLNNLVDQHHTELLARNAETAKRAQNASINRAINVEAWCTGINANSDAARRAVAHARRIYGGRLTYDQPDLPCERLIVGTLESSITKPRVSPASHPLVYDALSPKLRAEY